ncbi:hypothetical protein XENOCAPTIV_007259 [Xenoophorus captivus]|uniref:Uncharacterized protein n=1 Tax=Xenoophorus captivus TaxID=1517983 RepID=A0ABV0S1W5_9TELE
MLVGPLGGLGLALPRSRPMYGCCFWKHCSARCPGSLHVQHLPGIPVEHIIPCLPTGILFAVLLVLQMVMNSTPILVNVLLCILFPSLQLFRDVHCWVLVVTQWFPFQCSGVYPCWVFCSQFSPEHVSKCIEFNSIRSMMKHPSLVSFKNVLHGWSPKTLCPNCFNVSQCQQFPYCFFFKFCNPLICTFMYIRQPRDQSDQVHRAPRNILGCISFDHNWHLSSFCVSIRWMNIRPIAQIVPPVILFSVSL